MTQDTARNDNTVATQFARTFDKVARGLLALNPALVKSNNHKLAAINTTLTVTETGSGPTGPSPCR
ncbi:MAG: hypothetical protein ACRDKF_16945 [Actinomycetota bacterium]